MTEEVDAVCGYPQAHVASGKCDGSVPTCGVEELAMQVREAMEGWYFDTGASGHMSPSSEGMTNFQPCNKSLRVANGVTLPIKGKGNLVVEFQSDLESVRLQLHEVAYVPKLSYHLLSLSKAVEQGHKYIGDKNGLTMMLKYGKKLLVPNVRNMYLTYGYRPESDVEQACTVIAPGLLPTTGVDINHYHRTTAHTHPRLLRATAKQQRVKLDPKTKLLPCVGCSAAKGLSARLNKTTDCRSDKKMGRIFVDESSEKPVASKGGKKYSIIFRDDATRMSWIYFMRKKSESPDALDQFLAGTRETEEGLGGYDYNVLSDSLDLRPLEFDVKESNNNFLSLMSSMNDEYDDIALVVEGTEGESEFEMPSGPVGEAETPPVSVGGVLESRYKGAWLWAMNEELKGLKDSGTFEVLNALPEGEKAIGSRWVLSYKSNKDGNITKTKARLEAKWLMQREGVNHLQTSAPTPAGASVNTMLVVANEMGFKTYHLDVKQIFTKNSMFARLGTDYEIRNQWFFAILEAMTTD